MKSIVKAPTVPSLLTPWIACLTCNLRAYRVSNWRPEVGINPRMRQFSCPEGHKSYKVFTEAELERLTPVIVSTVSTGEGWQGAVGYESRPAPYIK